MDLIERKAIDLDLSDMDKEHRTAVVSHAHYDNIDRMGDISRKGMFNKSWSETKVANIRFDIDHDARQQPGKVAATFENERKAFTKLSFGNHTLGNDTMIMMDEGIIRGASFEFVTQKKSMIEVKGKAVRELREVKHLATTVTLSIPPVNPLAVVESVTKAMDITKLLTEFKAYVEKMESFCRNTTASDDCILNIQNELKAARSFLSSFDTAFTQPITAPDASNGDNDNFRSKLLLLTMQQTG